MYSRIFSYNFLFFKNNIFFLFIIDYYTLLGARDKIIVYITHLLVVEAS